MLSIKYKILSPARRRSLYGNTDLERQSLLKFIKSSSFYKSTNCAMEASLFKIKSFNFMYCFLKHHYLLLSMDRNSLYCTVNHQLEVMRQVFVTSNTSMVPTKFQFSISTRPRIRTPALCVRVIVASLLHHILESQNSSSKTHSLNIYLIQLSV